MATFHIAYLAGGFNTAFRKKYFLEAGGYSELPIMDDAEITSRMRKLGKILFDNSIFVSASSRRIEKLGIYKAVFLFIMYYLKLVLFGKKSIQIKDYAKQQY